MSAIRKAKIDAMINFAKTIQPKLKEEITKEMQEEINETFKDYDEKPEINYGQLKQETKERLVSKLKEYALKEFMLNRKTLSEYVQIVLLKLGYE